MILNSKMLIQDVNNKESGIIDRYTYVFSKDTLKVCKLNSSLKFTIADMQLWEGAYQKSYKQMITNLNGTHSSKFNKLEQLLLNTRKALKIAELELTLCATIKDLNDTSDKIEIAMAEENNLTLMCDMSKPSTVEEEIVSKYNKRNKEWKVKERENLQKKYRRLLIKLNETKLSLTEYFPHRIFYGVSPPPSVLNKCDTNVENCDTSVVREEF